MSARRLPSGSKAEQIAGQLLDRIIAAKLRPGSSFGTEAELLVRFAVSRPTLRESLRILEAQGVLELRPGPGGGIMVQEPRTDMLAHGLSVFLRMHEVPFAVVLRAREVVEPALAAEAAGSGSTADFAALAASIARMRALGDGQPAFLAENQRFHGIIARAGGNKVLEVLWSTISVLADGEHHGIRYSFANRRHVLAAHEAILEACRARDGVRAAACMRAHVSELESLVRSRYRHLLDQPTSVVARKRRRPSSQPGDAA